MCHLSFIRVVLIGFGVAVARSTPPPAPTEIPEPDPARVIAADALNLDLPTIRFYSWPPTHRSLPWSATISADMLLLGEVGHGDFRTTEPWVWPQRWWNRLPRVLGMLQAVGRYASLGPRCVMLLTCRRHPPQCRFQVMCPSTARSREGLYVVNGTGAFVKSGFPGWLRAFRKPEVLQFVTYLNETHRSWLYILDQTTEPDLKNRAWVRVNRTDPETVLCQVWSGGPLPVGIHWYPPQFGSIIQSTARGRLRTNVTTWSRALVNESVSEISCHVTSYRWNTTVRLPYEGPPLDGPWGDDPVTETDLSFFDSMKQIFNGTDTGEHGSVGFVLVAIIAVACTIAVVIVIGRRRQSGPVTAPPTEIEMQPMTSAQ